MKKFILPLFIGLSFCSNAQTLSPEVVGSAGDHFSTATVQLSWTIGEPVVETVGNASNTLTQGFHQTDLTGTQVNEISKVNLDVTAFPNPTSGQISFSFENAAAAYYTISFFDISGKLIKTESISYNGNIIQSDISNVSPGMYLVVITDQDQNQNTFQLIKQ